MFKVLYYYFYYFDKKMTDDEPQVWAAFHLGATEGMFVSCCFCFSPTKSTRSEKNKWFSGPYDDEEWDPVH